MKTGLLAVSALGLIVAIISPAVAVLAVLTAAAFAGGFSLCLLYNPKSPDPIASLNDERHSGRIEWEDVPIQTHLVIKIGYGLFSLVEDQKGAPLINRVAGIGDQLSRKLGFDVPYIPIKVDLSLEPNSYRIVMGRMVLAENMVWPGEVLAINHGDADSMVDGRPCKDPTFGMHAVWIHADSQDHAIGAGYLVVDSVTVIAAHLKDVVERNAAKLFGIDDATKLLDNLKKSAPQLVESLLPEALSLDAITAVCRDLLAEKIPLKDFRRISIAMSVASSLHSETASKVEVVRQQIADLIVQTMVPDSLPLPIMTVDASIEGLVVRSLKAGEGASYPIDPLLVQNIIEAVNAGIQALPPEARNVALITSPVVRRSLSALLKPRFPDLSVLSYLELPEDKPIEVHAKIGAPRSSHRVAVTNGNQI
ncbi:FHIPEP family type III secretion protein [Sphingorhabdus sp. M41]|uniref:FHIPEP family type III secretion protein n=1 Tax=Sphingorhabdus sp. M41 TaxID=1806885 RepID=UPI0018D4A220|nr:FHIPEP family type III secretion protein [Sphingorhabdus sp. M41]